MQKDLEKDEYYLNLTLNSSLPKEFKEKLLRYFRDKAIALKKYNNLKKYNKAKYTNNPFFRAKVEDYIILLIETFYTDKPFFEKTLKSAKNKFPENPKIKCG